jgi:hypothetical protein
MSKTDGDHCPICGRELFCFASAYAHQPFIDGKKYEAMCQLCYEVPKMAVCDENGRTLFYTEFDPQQLCSVEELMAGGWTKDECKQSLDAVKASIRKHLGVSFKRDPVEKRVPINRFFAPPQGTPVVKPEPPAPKRKSAKKPEPAPLPATKHEKKKSEEKAYPPPKYKNKLKLRKV